MITLKDLEPGDIFIHAKAVGRVKQEFIVKGNPVYNQGHGTSSRMCLKRGTNEEVSKSCRLEVKKIGESLYKAKFMERAGKTTKQ